MILREKTDYLLNDNFIKSKLDFIYNELIVKLINNEIETVPWWKASYINSSNPEVIKNQPFYNPLEKKEILVRVYAIYLRR